MALYTRFLAVLVFLIALTGTLFLFEVHVHAAGGAVPLATVGVGGRPLALGGAYTALADDGAGFSWNPAGPAALQQPQLFAERNVLIESTTFNTVAYTAPVGGWGVWTLGLRRLASEGIPHTDPGGTVKGTFDYAENVSSLNWARTLAFAQQGVGKQDVGGPSPTSGHDVQSVVTGATTSDLSASVGAQLKWVAQRIGAESASGFAADVGVQLRWPHLGPAGSPWTDVRVGAAFQNVVKTPVFWTTGTQDSLEANNRVGGAVSFSWRSLAGTVAVDWASQDGVAVGLEVKPDGVWGARGGWRYNQGQSSFTMGLGYGAQGVAIDYAFLFEPDAFAGDVPAALGNSHHISLGVDL